MSAQKVGIDAERRGWHIGKDIPVALLLTIAGLFAAGVTGYNSVQNSIDRLTEVSALSVSRLDVLSRTVQEGSVPSALNAARISVLEVSVAEIKARLVELERKR